MKREVDIPVITVGRIEPDVADALIADGACDFVAMGRKLLADPELPNKLAGRRKRGRRAPVPLPLPLHLEHLRAQGRAVRVEPDGGA